MIELPLSLSSLWLAPRCVTPWNAKLVPTTRQVSFGIMLNIDDRNRPEAQWRAYYDAGFIAQITSMAAKKTIQMKLLTKRPDLQVLHAHSETPCTGVIFCCVFNDNAFDNNQVSLWLV